VASTVSGGDLGTIIKMCANTVKVMDVDRFNIKVEGVIWLEVNVVVVQKTRVVDIERGVRGRIIDEYIMVGNKRDGVEIDSMDPKFMRLEEI
jgi:hypothetical protein